MCVDCKFLKNALHNGLLQCGYPVGDYPGTVEGNYLSGKIFPTWFGCIKFERI